jgi:RimJ/RimL family protein N-acetyltransferase
MLRIGQTVAVGFREVRSHLRQDGFRRTLAAALSTAISPVVRRRDRLIWEMKLGPRDPSLWEPGERLMILGPENIGKELSDRLRSFLGGSAAAAEIEGVRGGDRLFVVATETDFLACSYIFFDTTNETRRQARIYGERQDTPVIGMSFTSPAARGKGLYRRILNEMFQYLAHMNCCRVVCEVHPGNTPSNKASRAAGMRVCRELRDWAILNKLFIQRVTEGGKSRWRVLWV